MYYVLGIGNLTLEQCKEVLKDVRTRRENMKKAMASVQDEANLLEMIDFQVQARQLELLTKSKEK